MTAGGQFRLYYELYGVREGDPLNVELLIAPSRDESLLARLRERLERRAALQVQYREEGAPEGGVVRAQREIGAELQPGAYTLTLTVTNGRTNERASAEARIVVVDRR